MKNNYNRIGRRNMRCDQNSKQYKLKERNSGWGHQKKVQYKLKKMKKYQETKEVE